MRRIAILGAGGMGTALALLFRETGGAGAPLVALRGARGRTARSAGSITGTCRESEFPRTSRSPAVAGEAMDGADLIVAAMPSVFLRAVLESVADRVPGRTSPS